jgi:hypothetical protein
MGLIGGMCDLHAVVYYICLYFPFHEPPVCGLYRAGDLLVVLKSHGTLTELGTIELNCFWFSN